MSNCHHWRVSHQSQTGDGREPEAIVCRVEPKPDAQDCGRCEVGGAACSSFSVAIADVSLAVFDQQEVSLIGNHGVPSTINPRLPTNSGLVYLN